MAYTDLSLPELRTYTSVHAPADFDAFWSGTLDEARRHEHPDNVDQVIRTLGCFDGTVFAQRARMPALFSVG